MDIDTLVGPWEPVDDDVADAARSRQDQLVKPAGSLGRLEELGVRVATALGEVRPTLTGRAVVVFAADHGVAARGVSAYPQEVTAQMVGGFLAGGAAVTTLARANGVAFSCVDVGVAVDLPPHPLLHDRKVARGTADLTAGPAMTTGERDAALRVGVELAGLVCRPGMLVAGGDMGIGNTTAAAALTAALTGRSAPEVTGRGTGVDDDGLERKRAAVAAALALHAPSPDDPLEALRCVGGLEVAALTGFLLAAASQRCVVVVDGFIVTAAALVAAALRPAVVQRMVAAHVSAEAGHRAQLDHLGLVPVLDLGLRLGEASGAVLAMPVIEAAAAVQAEMATFAEAGVAGAGDG